LSSCTNSHTAYSGPDFIVITSPTGQDGWTTKDSSIDLDGFLANDEFFGEITWENNQGGSGTAKLTGEWTISDITLKPGDNIITVQTSDSSGETVEDSITVTHNPYLDFLGPPRATPYEFFVGEETAVVIQIEIEENANLNTSSVQVVRVDSAGIVTDTVTTLADDGNQTLGDETPGDSIYSGTATFNETEETEIRLRITATTIDEGQINTANSEVFILSAIAHVTDDELNRTLSMPEAGCYHCNRFNGRC